MNILALHVMSLMNVPALHDEPDECTSEPMSLILKSKGRHFK